MTDRAPCPPKIVRLRGAYEGPQASNSLRQNLQRRESSVLVRKASAKAAAIGQHRPPKTASRNRLARTTARRTKGWCAPPRALVLNLSTSYRQLQRPCNAHTMASPRPCAENLEDPYQHSDCFESAPCRIPPCPSGKIT